jgi:hypothetical protein
MEHPLRTLLYDLFVAPLWHIVPRWQSDKLQSFPKPPGISTDEEKAMTVKKGLEHDA